MKGFTAELRDVKAKAVLINRRNDGDEGETVIGKITIRAQQITEVTITVATTVVDLFQMGSLRRSEGNSVMICLASRLATKNMAMWKETMSTMMTEM